MADPPQSTPPAAPGQSALPTDSSDTEVPLTTLFEPTEECICPFGDIILNADDGFHPPQKLRVSSCILAMSSKVFKALFSKKFAEGQAGEGRSAETPHEILVKDAPTPLHHLCLLLHQQIPVADNENYISPAALLELGLVADKYDLVEAIRLQVHSLLTDTASKDDLDDYASLNKLVAASVLLDQVAAFRHLTKELVLRRPTIQAGQFDDQCLAYFPSGLLASLFSQQSIARQEFTAQITALIEQFSKASAVANAKGDVQKLIENLRSLDLMPLNFKRCNLKQLLGRLASVHIPLMSVSETISKEKAYHGSLVYRNGSTAPADYDEVWLNGGRPRYRRDSNGSLHSHKTEWEQLPINAPTHITVASSVKKIGEMCVGICLDCIQDKPCRVRHTHCWADKWADKWGGFDGETWDEVHSKIDIFNEADYPGYWDDAW
ncbi:hypothetical protein PRZ48_013147 [Zasmidium cellare]|uniref:BTB domain-containing protein n=1 Tax=Zasmidium cellare TaxID=395010 RepID=A0ABR0E381_ZASCE|nr:hypothetical protein PRZ48_013147 [Zasmidium cellare]